MKRTNYGIVKAVGYLPIDYYHAPINILEEKIASEWKEQKGVLHEEYIAFDFEGVLHFRKLYWKALRGYAFKFLNKWFYLEDVASYTFTLNNGVPDYE